MPSPCEETKESLSDAQRKALQRVMRLLKDRREQAFHPIRGRNRVASEDTDLYEACRVALVQDEAQKAMARQHAEQDQHRAVEQKRGLEKLFRLLNEAERENARLRGRMKDCPRCGVTMRHEDR